MIPSVNFPAIVNPHVEVYVGWNTKYPEALYGGYVVGGKPKGLIPVGDVNLHLDCVDYGTPARATAVVPGGVTYTTQTALRCTLAGIGRIRPDRARRRQPRARSCTTARRSCSAPT